MANPNILNLTSIYGKTIGYNVTSSFTTTGVSNSAGSNQVYKVNSIICSNIDGSVSADISLSIYKNQTTDFFIAKTILVPPDSSIVLLGKDSNPIYLEENDSIRASASANFILQLLISYEVIS